MSNGDNIFTHFIDAYSELASKPLPLSVFIISVLSLIAKFNNTDDPFTHLSNYLKDFIKNDKHSTIVINVASTLLKITSFIIKYEIFAIQVMLILIIPLSYRTDTSIYMAIVTLVYIAVTNRGYMINFVIIQLLFVYFRLQTAFERITVATIIIILIVGHSNLQSYLNY